MFRLWVCLFLASSAWGAKLVLPGMHTTMYYGDNGMVSPGSEGLVIAFAGTGGRTEDYGIEKVMKALSGRLIKDKWDTVAFENPLFWADNSLPDPRAPFLETYGNLNAQVQWMADAIRHVQAQNPGVPVWLATRSTSTLSVMQLMHEAYAGSERGEVLKGIQGVFAQGLLDPRKEAVDVWFPVEKKFLLSVGRADLPSLELDNVMFPAATWPTEALEKTSKFALPTFYVPMGTLDEVATIEQQQVIIELLAKNHPGLSIVGVGMDTHHNPESSVRYVGIDGKTVDIKTMGRLKPLLQAVLNGKLTPAEGGLRLVRSPSLNNFKHPETGYVCSDVTLAAFEESLLGF